MKLSRLIGKLSNQVKVLVNKKLFIYFLINELFMTRVVYWLKY